MKRFFSGLFAALVVVLSAAPFLYVFVRSFLSPGGVTFQYYYDVFLASPKYLFRFWKSIGMAVCIAAGQLFISVFAGFGFAKYKFPGRNFLFGTFILTQSFKSVPDTVLDAAMLDGCGVLRMLFYVVSPMNKSGLVCVLLLSFLDAWNMVEQPIAFLKEAEQYPISVALAYTPPSETSVQLVCCILVVLPALFLFTFFNRELVEGIVLAEVK